MAFTPQLLGKAMGSNVTSLSVNTSGIFAAGGHVYGVLVLNQPGFDDFVDSVGNVYESGGSQSPDGISAWLLFNSPNLRLPNNSTVTASNAVPWSGAMGVFGVSGLTSGELRGISTGQGNDASPICAMNVLTDDWVLAVVGVRAASTNTFTQGTGFTNPGNFNTQITTEFSTYAGVMQAPGGHLVWRPSLATAASWVSLMIAIAP